MTIDTKLVTIFGATGMRFTFSFCFLNLKYHEYLVDHRLTGRQGGSVVRSLIQNPTIRVRAITRNPATTKAKELASLGAEVVKADGNNPDELYVAFSGSWGAFVNTNSEDPVS